jgi:translocation and assembly module TamA
VGAFSKGAVLSRHRATWPWLPPLLLLLLLLLLPPLALAQETPGYRVEINGAEKHTKLLTEHLDIIRRRNDENLSVEELRRRVAVTPPQIRDLLATEGYFSPTIRHTLDRTTTPWTARFNIELGPPMRVDTVDINFKGDIAAGPDAATRRMNRLRRNWSLKPGEIFRQADWSGAKNALLKELLLRDYPAATIADSEARINPEASRAALTVEVDSGPAFTFGELEIQGLERYSRDMIARLNPIQPGNRYAREDLNELQARLEDTGYFRSAFATVEVDPSQPKHVPIRLDLVENPRKRLALGIGFSTDTGARAQVRWLDRNFLQRHWRLESELLVDRETRLLGGDVFLPAISSGWLPSFGARYERTITSGEISDKVRTGARLTSPDRADEKSWGIAYLADRQRIGTTFTNNRQALIGSFTYTRRRIDNPLTPRRGYLASIELGVGPRGLINEDNILRAVGRGTWIVPIVTRWRTRFRAEVGQVFGGDRFTVPGDLLFRTGGDRSVRGYSYQALGVAQHGAIVGGKVTAVLSAELVYQITPEWGAAVFTDAGDAADGWGQFDFKHGSGVGARWFSPIGPVNIDLAYGHATKEPRLHFSIGYGF